jgi:hypothetical protein
MPRYKQTTIFVNQSGAVGLLANTDAVQALTLAYTIIGAPATINIVVEGRMNDGSVDVLDTYTTVTNTVRTLSGLSKVYDYFAIVATWTGGVSSGVYLQVLASWNGTPSSLPQLQGFNLQLASTPPATANAAGTPGTFTWDGSNLYICVAANTWKKVGVATF